ncbi:kinesin-domain-containing protein [Clavulina sp. PMI_390]|nr:kinesin-domain-containing protein [Clavulina sp. PMI_390]
MPPSGSASASNTTSVEVGKLSSRVSSFPSFVDKLVPSPTCACSPVVRIRPTTSHDLSSIPSRFQRTIIHATSNTTVSVDPVSTSNPSAGPAAASASSASSNANKKQVFAFDQVMSQDTTQFQLFSTTAAPLISRFVEGFNCTILAYGQTSSGKTHSMTGVDLQADPTDPTNGMGIIPRGVSTIFARASELKRERGNAWQWSIKVSFIELYNEDLIDLLAVDEGAGRREVQIREEKDGTILWSGLREIPVRSAADVMAILAKGTANRRTNETDMNAQSSRSHAIFSVTLTQKKFSGSGTPPRGASSGRTSPMPPSGSPSSRIARPGSMYGGSPSRVASPTFGRAPPNSFGAAMSRNPTGAGMLRPSSALGMRDRAADAEDEERGEWTTVVSKFHFVDLAGSERLKRTAAAGERVKEGISINSGLLALGNVISALGDPSRAKTLGHGGAVHVPYRDSKLTRLLQDSLGGNAHTLMIACVSPSEWNHPETVNTLKYANRARNIRNRAEIREKEDGWDDLEWLQTMVTKLRKELKALKEGGGASSTTSTVPEPVATENPSKSESVTPNGSLSAASGGKVLKQYAELQAQYRNLRSEYVERNEELARMRKELDERSAPVNGAKRYEDIVGPVIEEYEKTISAMETELKLSRTALEHTNEMYNEQENELVVFKERTANADGYIEALRSRLARLTEREQTTEGYIRDLEAKLKAHADAAASEDSAAELRREIAKYKESEGVSATYIASLEQRLGRADGDIVTLRKQVDKFEAALDAKDAAIAKLETRIESMLNESEDMRQWKTSLAEREKRVQELERQMEEWEKVRAETGQHRQRLVSAVSEVESNRRSLEAEVNGATVPASPTHSMMTITPADSSELTTLREKHQSTLTELEEVSSKYRDALTEISDLAAQIAEAKLHSETSSEVGSSDNGNRPLSRSPRPSHRSISRRQTSESISILNVPTLGTPPPPSRRNFFRHAASSEGLHSRSQSQSLSSEFSSASFSRTSWANGDSLLSPTQGNFSRIHRQMSQDIGRSAESLEKEIQSLQKVLKDREAEIDVLEKKLSESTPGYFPVPPSAPLHDVKEETDVSSQPDTLYESELSPGLTSQMNGIKNSVLLNSEREAAERREAETITRLDELMRSMALKESQHVATVDRLNDELASLRRQHEDLATTSRDQAANMSTQSQAMSSEIEGLRADLATTEKRHSEASSQLQALRTRETDLVEAVRVAKEQHTTEMENLRSDHSAALQKHQESMSELVKNHDEKIASLQSIAEDVQREHEAAVATLLAQQATAADTMTSAHADAIAKLKSEHASEIQRTEEATIASNDATKAAHESAVAKLISDHEKALAQQSQISSAAISRLRDDHAAELRGMEMAREGTLTESQERQAAILEELHAEHRTTLERKEAEFNSDIEKLQTEHAQQHEELMASHAAEMDKVRALVAQRDTELTDLKAAHARSLEEQESTFNAQLNELNAQHSQALDTLATEKQQEIEGLLTTAGESKSAHEAALAAAAGQTEVALAQLADSHRSESDGLKAEHAIALNKLKSEHREALAEVQTLLASTRDEHRQTLSQLRVDQQAQIDGIREEHKVALSERDSSHERERETLRKAHQLVEQEATGLKAAVAQLESEVQASTGRHEQDLSVKEQHASALEAELLAIKQEQVLFADTIQELQIELERTREAHASIVREASKRQSIDEELEHHRSLLGDTQNELQRTRDSYDSLREEKARQDLLIADLRAQIMSSTVKSSRGIPPAKLPPLTPPPSIPPPPIPTSVPPVPSLPSAESASSNTRSSLDGSDESHASGSTPSTSVVTHSTTIDPKIAQQLAEQARHLEEQETMIKTLNKQLTHCESDLQAHMDLVATLETSLTDSERNLRKTRMQANEFSKERDRLTNEVESLRHQLQQAQQEVEVTRRSVIEEKQNYETRIEEERRAKERTRTQLEQRMDEITKKKSKYVCL